MEIQLNIYNHEPETCWRIAQLVVKTRNDRNCPYNLAQLIVSDNTRLMIQVEVRLLVGILVEE